MKCQPKANNNRKAAVVCAKHVVKRPSKRMPASTHIYAYFNCVLIAGFHTEGEEPGIYPPQGSVLPPQEFE